MKSSILLVSIAFAPAAFGQASEWGQCGGISKLRNLLSFPVVNYRFQIGRDRPLVLAEHIVKSKMHGIVCLFPERSFYTADDPDQCLPGTASTTKATTLSTVTSKATSTTSSQKASSTTSSKATTSSQPASTKWEYLISLYGTRAFCI